MNAFQRVTASPRAPLRQAVTGIWAAYHPVQGAVFPEDRGVSTVHGSTHTATEAMEWRQTFASMIQTIQA